VLDDPFTHRMTAWLFIEADGSLEGRRMMLEEGWRAILDSPIAGSLGSDIRWFMNDGSFIHGHLEIWRQYGIVPFALVAAGALFALIRAFGTHWKLRDPVAVHAVGLVVAIVLVCSISRSFGYATLWFGLGAALNRLRVRRMKLDAA
jgi:O-antigen ligase